MRLHALASKRAPSSSARSCPPTPGAAAARRRPGPAPGRSSTPLSWHLTDPQPKSKGRSLFRPLHAVSRQRLLRPALSVEPSFSSRSFLMWLLSSATSAPGSQEPPASHTISDSPLKTPCGRQRDQLLFASSCTLPGPNLESCKSFY